MQFSLLCISTKSMKIFGTLKIDCCHNQNAREHNFQKLTEELIDAGLDIQNEVTLQKKRDEKLKRFIYSKIELKNAKRST